MNDYKNEVLVIVKEGDRDGPPEIDLRLEYHRMVMSLRHNPRVIVNFKGLFDRILEPLAETKGELLIMDDGRKIYFAHEGIPFTDFGVILLEVINLHFLDRTQYYVELLVLSQDAEPATTRVEAKCIESGQWIEDLGVGYIYERRDLGRLNALIRTMSKYAPVKNEYQYSGWVLENGGFYMMDGQQLCGEDWDIERANASCRHTIEMLNVAPHSLTFSLQAIELLSLVHSKMVDQGNCFRGVCCIVAPTQSYKTTLASLFFDCQRGMEVDVNFEATMAAIIRTIGNTRDATVVLDDYKPGSTKAEGKEMLKKIGTIIRMCGDNSGGIKRAGTQNSTIENIARGLVVVTAEQIQLDVQSTLARLLVLEMSRKSVDVKKLTYFQETHIHYREFVQDYIMYISKQGVDKYCKNLAQRFSQERDVLKKRVRDKDILVDNRTNDMCVWLYISFTEFLKYARHISAINQKQFDEYTEEAVKVFLSILEQQAERVAELDDIQRFFRGLRFLLDTREVHIEKLQPRNVGFSVKDSKSAIGFTKQGFVFLKNEVAFQQVVAFYRRSGKEYNISESVLRKSLADKNYILPKQKYYIHRINVNREFYQCTKFEQAIFYKLLEGGKGNDKQDENGEIPGYRGMRQYANNILGGGE